MDRAVGIFIPQKRPLAPVDIEAMMLALLDCFPTYSSRLVDAWR
jgi:hypothetical protein